MSAVLHELAARLPQGAVSVADADRLAVSMDLWPRHILGLWEGRTPELPLGVVWPTSLDELQAVVAFAARKGIGLVPYGAGSSVVGGASARPEQIVVDLKRMARLLEVNTEARTATAQAGIMGELFERALLRQGFTQGHFPSSIYTSTLGGWIAARGAGQMSSRYGKIEDLVVGGALVTGDGTLVRQAPSPVRAALFDTLLGAEGQLAIWGEATVRIHPVPAARAWRGFTFPSLGRALDAAQKWLMAGLSPAVARIYDPLDTLLHKQSHAHSEPHDRGPSRLAAWGARWPRFIASAASMFGQRCSAIVGLQGAGAQLEEELAVLLDIAQACGAIDRGAAPGENWFSRRYAVSYRQSNALRAGVLVDTMEVACTWDKVEPVYQAVRRAGLGAGAQVLAHFSHIYLDGASIYFTYALPAARGEASYLHLWDAVLRAAVQAGANLSHHHGMGQLKAALWRGSAPKATSVFEEARHRHDPAHVLNSNVLAGPAAALVPPPREANARSLVCTAHPDESFASIEARLHREGQGLGPIAALFPSMTIRAAAAHGLLLRMSPQLRVIESLLVGLDTAGSPCTPAPRAAMGPDTSPVLVPEALRVWLRTMPWSVTWLRWDRTPAEALHQAQELTRDENLGGLVTVVHGHSHRAALCVAIPKNALGAARRQECVARLGPITSESERAPLSALAATPPWLIQVPWAEAKTLITQAADLGLDYVLPCLDPVGAIGILHAAGSPLSAAQSQRLTPSAKLTTKPSLGDASLHSPNGNPVSLPEIRPSKISPGTLNLATHAHELDNCTYCPKLSRFACPVAQARGEEALTPRQLMLTANLDRRGARPLNEDTALRLYSCVDCRGCKSFCDHDNDVAATLMDARAELHERGATPSRIAAVLDHFRAHGQLPDRPAPSTPAVAKVADTVVFFGCQNDSGDEGIKEALLSTARQRFGSVTVAPGVCCGQPLWRWGDREAFAAHARQVAASVNGASRLIVDDPGCAYTFRELYPQIGVSLSPSSNMNVPFTGVRTAASLLSAGVVQGGGELVPHDPCFAVRYLREPGTRSLMSDAGAGSVLEGQAGCCGGMLLPFYDAELADKAARDCASDLLGGGGSTIVTSSPTCRRRLRAAGAQVRDVFELI